MTVGTAFPKWLFALFAAAFVFYTDDYVVAGVLPELAADLSVSEGRAGQLVSVFSLTVALGTPVASVVLARIPRKRLFTAALLVFAAANIAAALSGTFAAIMALRVVAALSSAAATPALFDFAAQGAPPDRVGRYISIVSLGVTGSLAAGVPVGTWIGGAFGWRATFAVMAMTAVGVVVLLRATLPRRTGCAEPVALPEQLRVLARLPISLGLLANCMLMTGSMMMLTYLAPYLAAATTADVGDRAVAFGISGFAGVAGIYLGGVASDRFGADRALFIGVSAIVVSMLALWVMWAFRPIPLPAVLFVVAVWGGMAFWNSPAIQSRLHHLAGPVSVQALALNNSGTYLGVSVGAAVGGAVLGSIGVGPLPLVAAAFAAVAVGLLAVASRRQPSGGDVSRGN